ncbi:hypothetical protein GW17_00000712 [Ensete ventricosum]|nr:hypothetical protein GW17_00000712 [Ensete ventricosum]
MDYAGPLQPTNPRFGQIPLPTSRGLGVGGCGGGATHRRAHSENFIRVPDELLSYSDLNFGIPDMDFSSFSDEYPSGDGGAPIAAMGRPVPGAHLRSLSVDAAYFEGLSFQGAAAGSGDDGVLGSERKGHHRRSGSMDGAVSPLEQESLPPMSDFARKEMASDKLAELALIDPKRAKRRQPPSPQSAIDTLPTNSSAHSTCPTFPLLLLLLPPLRSFFITPTPPPSSPYGDNGSTSNSHLNPTTTLRLRSTVAPQIRVHLFSFNAYTPISSIYQRLKLFFPTTPLGPCLPLTEWVVISRGTPF